MHKISIFSAKIYIFSWIIAYLFVFLPLKMYIYAILAEEPLKKTII
nr:MAG TPA: hypothetical protein [Caudoviricetes sp.]DAU36189.1 MAG TPA: hypothetical protein [Caudoviricetes sp.]